MTGQAFRLKDQRQREGERSGRSAAIPVEKTCDLMRPPAQYKSTE